MCSYYMYLCMIALLTYSTKATPNDEGAPDPIVIGQRSPTGILTMTVFVTVTCTSYVTEALSGTTSLFLPSFTYDPLPSSLASDSLPTLGSTTMTGTFATSTSTTGLMDTSTTCSHTMPHIVPGNSSLLLPWVPKLPWITPSGGLKTVSSLLVTSFSGTKSPTSSVSNLVPSAPVVPRPGSYEFNWPIHTDIIPRSSPISALPSTRADTTASIYLPESNSTTTATASSSSTSGMLVHPRCKAKSVLSLNTEPSIKARDAATGVSDISTIQPSALNWKTRYMNTSSFAGVKIATPSEESKASKRRVNHWFRFFAAAEPSVGRIMNECLACDREGEVTCLPARRYMWCTDGCAITEKLGCDMVCEDGVIRKEGEYCVR
jgi:hypothetical protein